MSFKYTKGEHNDIKVIYSKIHRVPDEKTCQTISNPAKIRVEAKNTKRFYDERVYIKFETLYGSNCSMKVVFPNEDRREEKERKQKEDEENKGYKIDSKRKLR